MSLQPDPNSVVQKLLEKGLEKNKREEIVIDRIDDYKAALDRIFDSPDGQYFAKYLLRFIGLYADPSALNPAGLIEDKGKRAVYLKMIRPYLSRDVIMKIENQTDERQSEPSDKATHHKRRPRI